MPAWRLAYQTAGRTALLASFTYDLKGAPVSVQIGSDPSVTSHYDYVYHVRGDVVNLTDINGNVIASEWRAAGRAW